METPISDEVPELPEEVIEVILSKCSAKCVVRFKSVCKQWQWMISDPQFCRVHHLQRSKVRQDISFIDCWPTKLGNAQLSIDIDVRRLKEIGEYGKYVSESRVRYEFPILISVYPVCYCDGILMFRSERDDEYVFFNPTIRKHSMIRGPPVDGDDDRVFSLYHDSRDGDYKVVRVCKKHYTVYSCRNSSWGDMKDLPCRPSVFWDKTSCNGRFFSLRDDDEIECFDTRDGTLHRFPRPKDVKAAGQAQLAVLCGRLFFFTSVQPPPPPYSSLLLQKWELKPNIHGSFQNCWWDFEAEYEEEASVTFSPRSIIQHFPEQENLYLPASSKY